MFSFEKMAIKEIICVNYLVDDVPGSRGTYTTNSLYYYQLLYKLNGRDMVTFDGKTLCENQDDIRFLPNPGILGYSPDYYVDFCEQGDCINIAFTSDSPLPAEILVKNYGAHADLKMLFKKIQKIWYYKHDGWYLKCMAVLYEILYKILKEESEYLSSKTHNIIAPAIAYIDNNFTSENIDCNYLANLCDISYTYFSKIFAKQFGVTPNKYIVMKKINYACDLLKSGCCSVSKVAQMSGFSNMYYFSRVFKKTVGVCPSEYNEVFRINA